MATDPYGWAHQKVRAALRERGELCLCGEPATVPDHNPPLSRHVHIEGSGCCSYEWQCRRCSSRQGQRLATAARVGRTSTAVVDPTPEFSDPEPIPADDAVWDVEWLDDLRDVPAEAAWPRYMTAPHPTAVGSYGHLVDESAECRTGQGLRWWQRLVNRRLLEHDAAGVLVWLWALLSAARQSGKSWELRELAWWRMHTYELFGEAQRVVHTAKNYAPARDVMLGAVVDQESKAHVPTRRVNSLKLEWKLDGSTWDALAYTAAYSHTSSLAIVDEAWDVPNIDVVEGIEPTLLERVSSQLLLVSTAHRRTTALVPHRRATAIATLREPADGLILEWSAPRGSAIDDPVAWRLASPHWSPGRERHIAGKVAAALRGEGSDPDEPDPIEGVRAQYLNIWPNSKTPGSNAGAELVSVEQWAERATDLAAHTFTDAVIALEDHHGLGFGAVGAGVTVEGVIVVSAATFATRDQMLDWLAGSIVGVSAVLAGVTIADMPALRSMVVNVIPTGSIETAQALPMLRRGVVEGDVLHVADETLDGQVAALRVRVTPGGRLGVSSRDRSDLVRCSAWAVRHLQHGLGVPGNVY